MKTLHVTIYDEYECWSWHMFIYFLKFSSKKWFKITLCKIIIKIQYGNKKLHLDLHSFIWVFR